jgi:hypothetical protein
VISVWIADEQKLDQKLDHRAFEYHSPTGPSLWIKFSVPTGVEKKKSSTIVLLFSFRCATGNLYS